MKRIDALEVLAGETRTLPVIVTCAASSRELAAVADRPNHLYLLDAMGLAGSVATGIALAVPDSPVVTIEGDGSLLMNPNVLPTGGYLRPRNLLVVLLDNAVYGATGDLPTHAGRVDLGELAAGAGWAVRRAADPTALRAEFRAALAGDGPAFLHTLIEPGNASSAPKLLADPVVLGRRFQDWLTASVSRPNGVAK